MAKTPQVLGGGAQGHGGGNRPGKATAIWITGAAHLNCKEDGAMAKNSRQGQRSGTTPKKSGGHQEVVERPTGEGAFRGIKKPPGGSADWRRTPTSSPTTNNMGGAGHGDSAS
ncbi:hypothetical protein NDU88_007056 [Pleurodeles waltl]|uniref:Uncharacterized protein n=1 Tax=Pleurodeles waltl TaxID=8319 RepID=A0AAV7N127_PLEWA|nr:hypothetical protein NDU88_007056 [Pleurodeles waltl]